MVGDDSILARKQLKDIITTRCDINPIFFEASNGQEAVDLYKKESPDLVFLDIVMPVKDGNAAVREIMEYDSNAKVIIASSVGTQSQLKAAIQKPLNAEQVCRIFTSRVEGR